MSPLGTARTFSRLAEPDQWLRCRHEGTSLLDNGRGVELAWSERAPDPNLAEPAEPGGLAFDRWGRVYRSEPEDGRVVVLPRQASGQRPHHPGALDRPRGLAIDTAQRLYVAEAGRRRVLVVDLWGQRLLRAVPMTPGGVPVDVAEDGYGVLALVRQPDGTGAVVAIRGRRGPVPAGRVHPPPGRGDLRPTRLVNHPTAGALVLWLDPAGTHGLVCDPWGGRELAVPEASDLEVDGDGALVVARGPGSPFRAWRDAAGAWVGIEPVAAPGYDGAAIARDREGTIAYTTDSGVARSAGSAAAYRATGRFLTYRLDAGQYRTRWGRVLLDACIPVGTCVRIATVTSDDDEVVDPVPARAPAGAGEAPHAELTPPLPSAEAVSRLLTPLDQAIFRRPTGRERPWEQIANDDGYDTFEAPVADPGRYLWLVVELQGTANASPRVREVRVEHAGHRLDTQLPRMWSRDEVDASFLHRFLAPADSMLRDLDDRAAQRSVLLDPQTAPAEALDWLASFLGLVLDRRWTVAARRDLVAQAYDLFRRRGTRAALEEMLSLYLGRPVDIVESWRLRGLGGTVLGRATSGRGAPFVAEAGRSVEPLGAFIVGGPPPPGDRVIADPGADTAHRFTVIMPVPLNEEQRAVVASVVEAHKPAHTQGDICEFGDGMRISRSRIGLTSFVAPESGWGPEIVGQVLLGTDGVVGVPDVAARVGDTAIGRVRVG